MENMTDRTSYYFKRIGEIVVVFAFVAYVIGFIIISAYLATYQVTNIELLKGRYTLVGTVFLLYFIPTVLSGIIIGSIIKVKRHMHEWLEHAKDLFFTPLLIVIFSFISPSLIFILSLLGVHFQPDAIPISTIDIKGEFLRLITFESISKIFMGSLQLIIVFLGYSIIILLYFFVRDFVKTLINFKDLKKSISSIPKWLEHHKDWLMRIPVVLAKYGIQVFLLLSSGLICLKIVEILLPSKLRLLVNSYNSSVIFQKLYLLTILVVIFISLGMYLTSNTDEEIIEEKREGNSSDSSKLSGYLGDLFLVKMVSPVIMALFIPCIWYYSSFVYPILPSEIGGGLLTPVTILTEDKLLKNLPISSPQAQVFMLDRSDKVYVFLVKNKQRSQVYQIPIDKVFLVTEQQNEF